MSDPLEIRICGISIPSFVTTDEKTGKVESHFKNDVEQIYNIHSYLYTFLKSRGIDKIEGVDKMIGITATAPEKSITERFFSLTFLDEISLNLALPLIKKVQKDLTSNITYALYQCERYNEQRKGNKNPIMDIVPQIEDLSYQKATFDFLEQTPIKFDLITSEDVITIEKPLHTPPEIKLHYEGTSKQDLSYKDAIFMGYSDHHTRTIKLNAPNERGKYSATDIPISKTCEKFQLLTKKTYANAKIEISLTSKNGSKYCIDSFEVKLEEDLFIKRDN